MTSGNRLAAETSPYLRQHAGNPVHWLPWGDEAFAEARRRDVPLFVSIGYSACHWCHVMAHESFEDEATAALLNEHFVPVKVDREERPDVDAVYMDAVQALTGSGGWPLSAFATPDGRPFFAGTYFPPTRRHGTPAFTEVLGAVATAWTTRRDEVRAQADELTAAVARRIGAPLEAGPAGPGEPAWSAERADPRGALRRPSRAPTAATTGARALVDAAVGRFAAMYDAEHGGIGSAPKFPQAPMLELLLRAAGAGRADAGEMAATTLSAMAGGGIWDHLEGGFARYSVDRAWLVPHFEKMLYDQAALARLYLHAYQQTGALRWRAVVEGIVDQVGRDLDLGEGGVASSLDADAGGVEGAHATWTPDEIAAVLGRDDGRAACAFYGVTPAGQLDGRSVLHRSDGAAPLLDEPQARWRAALTAARQARVQPGRDDKALTEWNAMWCSTLAEAAGALDRDDWRARAVALGEQLFTVPRRPDGRFLRSRLGGRADHLAVAADYAWLVDAFTRLGEATGEARWTARAVEAAEGLVERFSAEDGGWYTTGADAERLVVRPRDTYDGVVPAAGSVAAVALVRLAALTGDDRWHHRAAATLEAAAPALAAGPLAVAHLVWAAELLEAGPVEVVVAGHRPDLRRAVQAAYRPRVVLAWGEPAGGPLWLGRDRPYGPGEGVAYVCTRGTCRAPSAHVAALEAALGAAGAGAGFP